MWASAGEPAPEEILPDLILVAVIFAIVTMPLGQFGRTRPSVRPGRSGSDRPLVGLPA
jgi:hypothetical protein